MILPPVEVSTSNGGSPVRVSVITTPPSNVKPVATSSGDPSVSSSPHSHSENPLEGVTNGLPHSSTSPDSAHPSDPATTPTKRGSKAKTPQTPKSLISPEGHLDPAAYKYVVEYMSGSDPRVTAKPNVLSRPKGALVPTRLKIFLRNATYRSSDRHPFTVKVSLVNKCS